jgi:pimeloyl-ACP methyl ester carboxylesterase
MQDVKPFKIEVPQAVLDDLKDRLAKTRWPAEAEGAGWRFGTNAAYMRKLVEYWRTGYDWRKHEQDLNTLSHFRAAVDGVGLHFIHERGQGPDAAPLLLLHGWPDSFYRYRKVIPRLTRPGGAGGPGDTFDVVVPSLPGFGFSDRKPMNQEAMADLLVKLMRDVLGYRTFLVAGGDVGSPVAMAMAHKYPEAVEAVHLTDVGYPTGQEDFSTFSPAEREFARFLQEWWMSEGAFNIIQSNKPQTLAFGMNDSPAGWAAWVMSFICINSTGEELEKRLGRDEILTNIMIYWVTETIASSFRYYYETARAKPAFKPGERLKVPSAVAHATMDAPLPREWAERRVELLRFTELPGGHFAAWESPDAFAADVRGTLSDLRNAQLEPASGRSGER